MIAARHNRYFIKKTSLKSVFAFKGSSDLGSESDKFQLPTKTIGRNSIGIYLFIHSTNTYSDNLLKIETNFLLPFQNVVLYFRIIGILVLIRKT